MFNTNHPLLRSVSVFEFLRLKQSFVPSLPVYMSLLTFDLDR